ncbi:hypothetical protein BLNAU_17689 [Blattamonas nauphoetae]|uniref:Uncharacterized protein n=1 Tax=Blattamonas nauphoetae TaxID=2049346 RepID=A0ABQ9X6H1_9EUKA|nr:hypothetical protein BLNAU_17689 [Blattamonas nauphoetae]
MVRLRMKMGDACRVRTSIWDQTEVTATLHHSHLEPIVGEERLRDDVDRRVSQSESPQLSSFLSPQTSTNHNTEWAAIQRR